MLNIPVLAQQHTLMFSCLTGTNHIVVKKTGWRFDYKGIESFSTSFTNELHISKWWSLIWGLSYSYNHLEVLQHMETFDYAQADRDYYVQYERVKVLELPAEVFASFIRLFRFGSEYINSILLNRG